MRTTLVFALLLTACFLIPGEAAVHICRAQGGTTTTGASREMNPALSLNGIFVGEWQDEREPGEQELHLALQEVELAAMSVVDPFFKAHVYTSFGPGHEHHHENGEETEEAHGDQIEVEEAFVQSLSLPVGWGLRAGKMLVPFGRSNQIHLHHLPFINAQLGFREMIDVHGVSDVGAELSYAPGTPWYLNMILFAGDGHVGFLDAENKDLALTGRLENLWDLGEAATLEVAASALTGPDVENTRRTLYGADLRIKWRDQRRTHGRALEWMTEFIFDSPEEGAGRKALLSYARCRIARSWWLGTGYSLYEPESWSRAAHEFKTQLAFVPSEFSALRLDGSYVDSPEAGHVLKVQLQLNFTIGSHPAHLY